MYKTIYTKIILIYNNVLGKIRKSTSNFIYIYIYLFILRY
jgi:hypothetical protein